MNELTLLESMKRGRIPHAILIVGPEGSGRHELARRMCGAYCLETVSPIPDEQLESFPDYKEYAFISMGDVRAIEEDTAAGAFSNGRRAFMLRDVHKMTGVAQNALLKTLEEPPDNTLFILTGNEDGIEMTIRSRCAIWRMGSGSETEIAGKLILEQVLPKQAELAASLSDGIEGLARKMCDSPYFEFRDEVIALVERALFGTISFVSGTKFLQKTEVFVIDLPKRMLDEISENEEDEELDSEQEKKRISKSNAPIALSIMASLIRDAMVADEGGRIMNTDREELVRRICGNFTKADILDIIKKILEIQKDSVFNMNPNLAVDSALTYMLMVRERKHK